jgi:hydroxyacylglutathione hydrolase
MSVSVLKMKEIEVIWGDKQSRFPHCNTIFVDDEIKAVIDPAARLTSMKALAAGGVDLVLNSHYHFDHIRFNHLFTKAKIQVHENDRDAMTSIRKFAEKYGALRVMGETWINQLLSILKTPRNEEFDTNSFTYDVDFYRSIGKVDDTFSDGDTIYLGESTIEVIHSPGHSDSMCCFFFPAQSLCYTSDYSVLTEWGPWYGGEDSNIADFLRSIEKLKKLDAQYYLTAHDQFMLTKEQFFNGMEHFISIIDKRHVEIEKCVKRGMDFYELAEVGFFYKPKYWSIQWVKIWETMMLIKHLEHMALEKMLPEINPIF